MGHGGRPNLPAITGLRFFLALLVVAFHASGADGTLRFSATHVPLPVASLISSGYAAVSFFFVLSGFVLAYGYNLKEPWTRPQWRRFLVARVARIYPVYALALIVSLPLALVVMRKEPGHPLLQNIATLTTTPLLLQAWLPGSSTVWNGPGWSLSTEALFYLSFPILGLRLWRIRSVQGQLLALALIWLAIMGFVSILAQHVAPDLWWSMATEEPLRDSWNAVIKFNPLMHLAAFLTGILTAKIFVRLQGSSGWLRPGRGAWLFLPAIAVELLIAINAYRIHYPLMHDGLLIPVHAALITGLALGGGVLPTLLGARPLVLLGQSSYALYLLHVPLDRIWIIATKHVLHRQLYGPAWFCVYASLCTALSCVIFLRIEEPMRRKIMAQFAAFETRIHLSSR